MQLPALITLKSFAQLSFQVEGYCAICVQRMSVCHWAGLDTQKHLAQEQETETIWSCTDLPKDFFLVSLLPFPQQSLEQQEAWAP